MRIMAIDYGDSRTGIAVSDPTLTLVGEAFIIHSKNMRETARLVAEETAERDVSCIVVGYPKNMDGSIGARAGKSERFAGQLRALCNTPPNARNTQVTLWDERLTTAQAHNILSTAGKFGKKRKQTVDAVAASLILESYLASNANPASIAQR